MSNYRRHFVPGGSYFFTLTLADRRASLLTDHVELLREAFRQVKRRHPFVLDAVVVLPDHLHLVMTLPEADRDYPTRLRLLKSGCSRVLPGDERRSSSRRARHERGSWQKRYWEHCMRDGSDFNRHLDYIHFNPVRHGHVASVPDWPYSSFHRHVAAGRYPVDWGGGCEIEGCFGERA